MSDPPSSSTGQDVAAIPLFELSRRGIVNDGYGKLLLSGDQTGTVQSHPQAARDQILHHAIQVPVGRQIQLCDAVRFYREPDRDHHIVQLHAVLQAHAVDFTDPDAVQGHRRTGGEAGNRATEERQERQASRIACGICRVLGRVQRELMFLVADRVSLPLIRRIERDPSEKQRAK